MIIDHITNAHLYSALGPALKRAFDYLQQTDLAALANGRYEIDGERMFVIVQESDTKTKEQGKWEAHRRYIDIQYIVRGAEQIGYTRLGNLKPTTDYVPDKDVIFLSGGGDFLIVPEGGFMLLFPEDAHMPGIAVNAPTPVKKAVVKIAIT